jgi:diadenosine tetraphosphate (Ap4A) HIT family hydrolase
MRNVLIVTFIASVTTIEQAIAQTASCAHTVPDLYESYKASVVGSSASDDSLRRVLHAARGHVRSLPDPLSRLAGMTAAKRRNFSEIVVWEDTDVMVLVAKPHTLSHVLVVPKKATMFLTDATPTVQRRLATVAGAAAAAFPRGASCGGGAVIRISPPSGLQLRQLHVHVMVSPSPPADTVTFYREMGARIAEIVERSS